MFRSYTVRIDGFMVKHILYMKFCILSNYYLPTTIGSRTSLCLNSAPCDLGKRRVIHVNPGIGLEHSSVPLEDHLDIGQFSYQVF